jgi:hypothetical protein
MDVIKNVAQFFLIAIAMGTYFFSFITPSHLTGAGFIRLIITVSLGAIVSSGAILATQGSLTSLLIGLYILNIILLTLTYKFHQDQKSKLMSVLSIAQNISFVALSYYFVQGNLNHFLYLLLTSFFIGICNYCMILGHYYLVVPKLSEWPLLRSLKIFWLFIGLKAIVSVWAYFQEPTFFISGSAEGAGYMFNWVLLLMRVFWGYVALGICSFFAFKLCKMRSIQSATGVFYIMVFFILVGEIISGYLFHQYGLYI